MIKMPQPQPNCQPIRYCWDAEKVKNLIRLRAELSPLFTGKRNASKYAWTVVEQELNVPLPLSKIIKKWNNLLQEYKAIKLSEEPKRREWPFFTLMDLYFSDQVNDPTLRLFSSTKTFCDTIDDKEDYSLTTALATVAAAQNNAMSGGSLLDMSDLKSEIKSDQNETDLCDSHESKYCHNNNNNNSNLNNNNNNSSTNNNNDSNINSNSSNNNQSTNNNNRNSNNSNNNNNNNNTNNSSNYGQIKSIQSQHSHLDYDDVASDYGNDLDNSSTNDILNRASEHHNIAQYLLSWNNFHGNMCKGFHNLQKDGQMVDVTIAAGGKIFKAHKLVLSVCSPYFQKIFLENPSTHPILFMTDVNSNYMAGLLDFMYSGQVNVKYDDLPSFLKVAEAMQIKGLHTESTKEDQEEKEQAGSTSLFQSQLQQQQIQRDQIHQQLQQQAAHQHHQRTSTPIQMSNKNRVQQPPTKYIQSPKHTSSPYRQGLQEQSYMQLQTLNLSQNRNLNKDVQTKSMLNEDIDSHSNNNSSNNPSQISNNNNSNNNLNNSSKYVIQQTNISNKLLDNQKYPKYYSKRKLLAQYEQEMRNQKRCRPTMLQEDVNRNYKQTLNLINNNNNEDPIDTTTEQKSGLITNIKLEPDRLSLQSDNVNNNSSNNNNNTDDDNNNNNNKNNNNSNYFNSSNNNNNDSTDNNVHTFSTIKQQQQPPHSNHDSNDGLNLKTTPDQPKLNPSSIKSSS